MTFWGLMGECLVKAAALFGIVFGGILLICCIVVIVAVLAARPLLQSMGSHGDAP